MQHGERDTWRNEREWREQTRATPHSPVRGMWVESGANIGTKIGFFSHKYVVTDHLKALGVTLEERVWGENVR